MMRKAKRNVYVLLINRLDKNSAIPIYLLVSFPLPSLKTYMDRIQPLSHITGVNKFKSLGFRFPLTLIKLVKYRSKTIAL